MIKRRLSLHIGALCLLGTTLQGCNSDSTNNAPVSLKFNFTPGANYHYTIVSKETLEPEVKGGSLTITQNRIIESTFGISPASNNSKKLVFTIDRIAISAGNDNTTVLSYDSRNGNTNNNSMFQNIEGLLHKPYNAIISNTGNIQIENTGAVADSTGANQLGTFNNASVSAMLNDMFSIFPTQQVKPGDSWKRSFNTSIGFVNVVADNNYKLVSVSKGIALIDINSNITSLASDTADVSMKGVQVGNMQIDIASGLIISYEMKAHINGSIQLGINTQAGLSSEVHITGKKDK